MGWEWSRICLGNVVRLPPPEACFLQKLCFSVLEIVSFQQQKIHEYVFSLLFDHEFILLIRRLLISQHTRSPSSTGRQIHTPKGGAYLVTYCIRMHGPQRGAPSCHTWDTAAWHLTHFAAGLQQHVCTLYNMPPKVFSSCNLNQEDLGASTQLTPRRMPQASMQPTGGKTCRLLYPDAGFTQLPPALIFQPRHPATAMDAHRSQYPG